MDEIKDFNNQLDTLKILDNELNLKLAGNNPALAHDMLSSVLNSLSENIDIIKLFNKNSDYIPLQKAIHKLHGAVCYIGAPRLKFCLSYLETRLKRNIMDSLQSLIAQLENEANLLLEHHSRLPKRSSMQG